jgi:hypothetical protein
MTSAVDMADKTTVAVRESKGKLIYSPPLLTQLNMGNNIEGGAVISLQEADPFGGAIGTS